MRPMEYLKKAQDFVESRGDSDWFSHYYTFYRQEHDVRTSVQQALWQLYGDWKIIPDALTDS